MGRFAMLTAALGAFTAIWTIAGVYLSFLVHRVCFGDVNCAPSNSGWVVQSLAVVLLIVSAGCFVGPRSLFYVSALLSAVLAGTVYVQTDMTGVAVATMLLYLATLALSVLAARRHTSMSEQSNPMNLPVFG